MSPVGAALRLLSCGPPDRISSGVGTSIKLRAASKWNYFYLDVVMYIFSRKIAGWDVYLQETGTLAEALIPQTAKEERFKPGQVTIHSDIGESMMLNSLAELLSDLSISKSYSRKLATKQRAPLTR
jgi:putative transposase